MMVVPEAWVDVGDGVLTRGLCVRGARGQAMQGSLAWWAEGFAGRKGAMGLGVMLGLARPDNVGEAVGLLGN